MARVIKDENGGITIEGVVPSGDIRKDYAKAFYNLTEDQWLALDPSTHVHYMNEARIALFGKSSRSN